MCVCVCVCVCVCICVCASCVRHFVYVRVYARVTVCVISRVRAVCVILYVAQMRRDVLTAASHALKYQVLRQQVPAIEREFDDRENSKQDRHPYKQHARHPACRCWAVAKAVSGSAEVASSKQVYTRQTFDGPAALLMQDEAEQKQNDDGQTGVYS